MGEIPTFLLEQEAEALQISKTTVLRKVNKCITVLTQILYFIDLHAQKVKLFLTEIEHRTYKVS